MAEERSHNVVMVKENRSSASSSGYESKSCSSLDEEQRREDATRSATRTHSHYH